MFKAHIPYERIKTNRNYMIIKTDFYLKVKVLLLIYEMGSQIVREAAQPLLDDHQHMPMKAVCDHCLLFVD